MSIVSQSGISSIILDHVIQSVYVVCLDIHLGDSMDAFHSLWAYGGEQFFFGIESELVNDLFRIKRCRDWNPAGATQNTEQNDWPDQHFSWLETELGLDGQYAITDGN